MWSEKEIMQKKDSLYQLLLAIVFVVLGCICFIPNVNFLQLLICFSGIVVLIIGLFFFIRGLTKYYDRSISKFLIIGGIIVALVGISISILVWVLFNLYSIILGGIFIIYAVLGLIITIRDKYGLMRVRILSSVKNILYIFVGSLIILDCYFHHMIIDYILGILLITDGVIGISTYISSYKIYHNSIIDIDEYNIEDLDEEVIENE